MHTLSSRGFSLLLVLAAAVLGTPALAHPHGTMQCGLSVHYDDGQPQRVTGRLLMDAAHSGQALAQLRDEASGQLDPARQQRFLFALKMQMARFNWLLAAETDGQAAELVETAAPTLLLTPDGRLGLSVDLAVQPKTPAPPGAPWTFACHDPSWYWVSEFAQPEAPMAITGCARAVAATPLKVSTGPKAGSVQVEVRCAP